MADKPTIKQLINHLANYNGDVSKLQDIGWFRELDTTLTELLDRADLFEKLVEALRHRTCNTHPIKGGPPPCQCVSCKDSRKILSSAQVLLNKKVETSH